MEWHVFTVGKPSLGYAKDGFELYAKRTGRWGKLIHHVVKKGSREDESNQLLSKSQGMWRIALDERGKILSTRDWSEILRERFELNAGGRKFAFLIGGADGHDPKLRESVDAVWSLSGLTLQHELALLLLAEQIYRVHTLWEGLPYHRD